MQTYLQLTPVQGMVGALRCCALFENGAKWHSSAAFLPNNLQTSHVTCRKHTLHTSFQPFHWKIAPKRAPGSGHKSQIANRQSPIANRQSALAVHTLRNKVPHSHFVC